MAKHSKAYRFRMKPTTAQGHALNRMAGARRWVWNWALRRWKNHYAATGKSIPLSQLSSELTALKQHIQIGRFFPSSKMCNVCGAINNGLTLSDREWDCDCATNHQRDFHAACNIKDEGLRTLAAGQAGESQRSGRQCKTRHAGQLSLN